MLLILKIRAKKQSFKDKIYFIGLPPEQVDNLPVEKARQATQKI
jgi:hypothetical protein